MCPDDHYSTPSSEQLPMPLVATLEYYPCHSMYIRTLILATYSACVQAYIAVWTQDVNQHTV